MRRVRDLQPYVGQEIEAKIIELDKNRNNVVLSRRAWLEQTQSEVRQSFLHQLQKDRKSTRLNSSHTVISYAVFCLKKKKTKTSSTQPKNKTALCYICAI